MSDKLEAVQKVSETLSKQNTAEDRQAPNKEHFDSLMTSSKAVDAASFERIDSKAYATEEVSSDKNPILADEGLSSQKSGSSTDQDQKKRKQQEETEEIEGIGSARPKTSTQTTSASLMDEVSKINSNVAGLHGSPEAIKAQAKDAIAQIEQMKTKLSQVQGDIKPSYQTVLRNRLSHIDDNLKIALNKAGIEYTPPVAVHADNKNAVHKFINYLTSSEHHLNSMNAAMDGLSSKDLTPARMLAIQMKMTTVSQQLELFSNLLNKALESTKTIMNIQV